jgi:hypothetical protein
MSARCRKCGRFEAGYTQYARVRAPGMPQGAELVLTNDSATPYGWVQVGWFAGVRVLSKLEEKK